MARKQRDDAKSGQPRNGAGKPGYAGRFRVVTDSAGSRAPVPGIDVREGRLFKSLDVDNDQRVRRSELERRLVQAGLRRDDLRVRDSMTALDAFLAAHEEPEEPIPQDNFCKAIRQNILLIERALQGQMVIPDFT